MEYCQFKDLYHQNILKESHKELFIEIIEIAWYGENYYDSKPIDAEAELTALLVEQIAQEIDREIIQSLFSDIALPVIIFNP